MLWWIRGNRPSQCWVLPVPVRAATVDAKETLWLGTEAGLMRLDAPNASPERVPLPALNHFPAVNALSLDKQHRLWVGAERYGVFAQTDTSWHPVLAVAPVYALSTTADGTVWVGSGIGLFRQTTRGWQIYSEEGTGNHGLPDNLVENLIPLPTGLWVIMSESISFFPIDTTAQPVEFAYLGHPGNYIYDAIDLPNGKYLLATDEGLVLLRELPRFEAHTGLQELRVLEHALAHLLSPQMLGLPKVQFTRLYRKKQMLYLAGPTGLYRVPLKKLQSHTVAAAGH